MGTLRIASTGKWLDEYITRDKAFNDAAHPRVLAISAQNCTTERYRRDFARIFRELDVPDERVARKGLVFSWGDDEVAHDDKETQDRCMAAVELFFAREMPGTAAVLVAQCDGKGGKFHIHGDVPNVALWDTTINGLDLRKGQALGGKALDVEFLRQRFDECCREVDAPQRLLPYEKGDRRYQDDQAARREGRVSKNDDIKDRIEAALERQPRTFKEFAYELGVEDVELRVEEKRTGQYAGQTWFSYKRPEDKTFTRDRTLGIERYGSEAIGAALRSPGTRKPRTVNPLAGPPARPRALTDAEKADAARVVAQLSLKGAALRQEREQREQEALATAQAVQAAARVELTAEELALRADMDEVEMNADFLSTVEARRDQDDLRRLTQEERNELAAALDAGVLTRTDPDAQAEREALLARFLSEDPSVQRRAQVQEQTAHEQDRADAASREDELQEPLVLGAGEPSLFGGRDEARGRGTEPVADQADGLPSGSLLPGAGSRRRSGGPARDLLAGSSMQAAVDRQRAAARAKPEREETEPPAKKKATDGKVLPSKPAYDRPSKGAAKDSPSLPQHGSKRRYGAQQQSKDKAKDRGLGDD